MAETVGQDYTRPPSSKRAEHKTVMDERRDVQRKERAIAEQPETVQEWIKRIESQRLTSRQHGC